MPSTDPLPDDRPALDDAAVADEAVRRVAAWLAPRDPVAADDQQASERLHQLIDDPDGVTFTMHFVDRVIRPDDDRIGAGQLHELVTAGGALPRFLSRTDRVLLHAGARLAPVVPRIVMPLARRRMRQLVGHLLVDARPGPLRAHLADRRREGFDLNVNLLGEAVLGEGEALRRLDATEALLAEPDIDYVSVKISGVASQLNPWAWDDSVDRISDRLRRVLTTARERGTFVNLDMEEYHDLELTMAAFRRVLDEPDLLETEAGIVLQAYLPDSFDALRGLVAWATDRRERGGAGIKIRLVKGANLAMERVDAAMHGWEQAPYPCKADTDANFKRCIDWAFTAERTAAVRYGIGSHNLFDVAFALLVAEARGVAHRVGIEMLEGMAPSEARTLRDATGNLLLYTPVVDPHDFDVAISYLFRRLEENAAPGNFLRSVGSLRPGTTAFAEQEAAFRRAVAERWAVSSRPRRTVDRTREVTAARSPEKPFCNDPETDPAVAANRTWALGALQHPPGPLSTPVEGSTDEVLARLAAGREAQRAWWALPPADRRRILSAVGDEMARRRRDLTAAMVHEGRKTVAQADPEVCEAIDFARYYATAVDDLDATGARFEPLGVVVVVPPWNFPVAIPAGGVLAALAAGNAVVLKPAPETPRCAEIVAECCWAAGVPADVLQYARVPEDDAGRALITGADAVILTGSTATADLFRSWRPDLRLFAETSGKNAIVITPNADLDLAVRDVVDSAFGHAGQKCSAASLAICVGEVHRSARFRRQLRDAVESLAVGESTHIRTRINGLIGPPGDDLRRALTVLDDGESWLVEPRRLGDDDRSWSPGVRWGVRPGSWFHHTECFGPVLGVMAARDLDEALELQNAVAFGLTGGLQSLDPAEVEHWSERVEVGNAYVNRGITGAIVQRQPFGGWKRSSVGPGAKAGGPNYVRQLGHWVPDVAPEDADEQWLTAALADDERWWAAEHAVEHDPTGLFCEANRFRYRPLPKVALRVGPEVPDVVVDRVRAAIRRCGVPAVESHAGDEDEEAFARRLGDLGVPRVRVLGEVGDGLRRAAVAAGVHLADDPVTPSGRVELLHHVREQVVTETLHRFGNLVRR